MAESDRHGMNLFLGVVGATSKGRKGSSWGHVRRLFGLSDPGWVRHCIGSGLSSGEGVIHAVRDPEDGTGDHTEERESGSRRRKQRDAGVSDKRLLVVESELVSTLRVMGRTGSTLSALLRQAWDTGDLRVLNKNSPIRATGSHISVIGHITLLELRRELSETDLVNGFGNRFLWIFVERSKFLPEGGNLNLDDLHDLAGILSETLQIARSIGRLDRDDNARELWAQVYVDLSSGRPGLLGAVISRAEAQVMRLACVYALLDGSWMVRAVHLEAALALWRYCESSCVVIFDGASGDPTLDAVRDCLDREPAGVLRSELYRLRHGHSRREDIDRALGTLERSGQARRVVVPTSGRPAERWYARRGVSSGVGAKDEKKADAEPAALLSPPSQRPQAGVGVHSDPPEPAARAPTQAATDESEAIDDQNGAAEDLFEPWAEEVGDPNSWGPYPTTFENEGEPNDV
jgi:Protein of unknown function (DUF3987)